MEFKVDVKSDGSSRVARLAGRLGWGQVGELERSCGLDPVGLSLDLSDLISADSVGLEALRVLERRGARLMQVPPYLAMQLQRGGPGV